MHTAFYNSSTCAGRERKLFLFNAFKTIAYINCSRVPSGHRRVTVQTMLGLRTLASEPGLSVVPKVPHVFPSVSALDLYRAWVSAQVQPIMFRRMF